MKSERLQIISGDARTELSKLPSESVHCCVTSPPYWGLRDYGSAEQIGLEKTPQAYVETMREVFSEVRRVLRNDGTLWLNLGDSYAGAGYSNHAMGGGCQRDNGGKQKHTTIIGLKPKDLVGIPWRVAFALQDAGWYLRSDIIWHKPNPMPESVLDRPTRCHEYIFLLSKSPKYYYDAAAIREPAKPSSELRWNQDIDSQIGSVRANGGAKTNGNMKAVGRPDKQRGHSRRHDGFNEKWDALTHDEQTALGSNKRDVWIVAPANYKDAHFATFPVGLIKPCILAGCPVDGTVLDPFFGSGTTGLVALELGRKCIGIELNPEYVKLAEQRCNVTPGLSLI